MIKYPIILVMAGTRWHYNKFKQAHKKTAKDYECSRMMYLSYADVCKGIGGASLIYLESAIANKAYYEKDFVSTMTYVLTKESLEFLVTIVIPKFNKEIKYEGNVGS